MATSDIDVRLRVTGGRQFQRQMQGASQTIGNVGSKAKVAFAAVGLGAAAALGSAVKSAANFEQQMSSLGAVTNASAATLDKLRKSALAAGKDTVFSAGEAAQAQTELAKGGVSASDILSGGLKASLALASAGELDLADAASYTANALNLFGLKGKDAGTVADALAVAANATTADVGDFGMALTQGGAVAKSAGLSFNETVTALEALAKAGVKNSDAGTSLKTALIQLIKPTDKQAKLADKLGLSFVNAHGKFRSLADISGQLRTKLHDQGAAQRTATLATLAGTDGVRTLTALYDAGPKKLTAYSKGLRNVGYAAEVAKKKQDNLKGRIENLKGALETLAISVGTVALPPLTRLAEKLTAITNAATKALPAVKKVIGGVGGDLARGAKAGLATRRVATPRGQAGNSDFAPKQASGAQKFGAVIRQTFDKVLKAVKGFVPVATAYLGQVLDALKPAAPLLKNVILPALVAFGKGILSGIVAALKLAVPVIRIVATVLGFVGKALKPLTPVFKALGFVVGFIVGPAIVKVIAGFGKGAVAASRLGRSIGFLLTPFKLGGAAISRFVSAIGRMFPTVKAAVAAIEVTIKGLPGAIGGTLRRGVGVVGRGAIRVADAILNGIGRVVGRVPGRVGSMLSSLGGTLRNVAVGVARAAGTIGSAIVDGIVAAIKAAPTAILSAITSIVPGPLRSAISGVVGGLGSAASSVGGFLGIGGNAHGGHVRYGTTSMVGEQGPELVTFKSGGVSVKPASQTKAGSGAHMPRGMAAVAPAPPVQFVAGDVYLDGKKVGRHVLREIHAMAAAK